MSFTIIYYWELEVDAVRINLIRFEIKIKDSKYSKIKNLLISFGRLLRSFPLVY